MNGRIRTQKKIFTPTIDRQEAQCFLCQFIDNGEFMILHRSSVKRIYDNTAEVMVCGRRLEAKIEFQGTQEECQRAWEQAETGNMNNFDDEEEDDNSEKDDVEKDDPDNVPNDILNISSNVVNKIAMSSYTPKQKRKQSELGSTTDIHCLSTTSNSIKKSKKITHLFNQIDLSSTADENEKENQSMNSSCLNYLTLIKANLTYFYRIDSVLMKHIDSRFDTMQEENKKQYVKLLKQIDGKHVDSFDLAAYRAPGEIEQFDDVMHGTVNLTHLRGKSISDYSRQVLRTLFTEDELISSILPPGGSQYSRKPLNNQRFQRLHDALRSKYKITSYLYDDFYQKLVRRKLADFLIDERKRARKKNSSTNALLDV